MFKQVETNYPQNTKNIKEQKTSILWTRWQATNNFYYLLEKIRYSLLQKQLRFTTNEFKSLLKQSDKNYGTETR